MVNEPKKPNLTWPEKLSFIAIIALFVGWAAFVIRSGKSNWTGIEWNFAQTGQFGDSFGFIGSLMATLAATFTYLTLRNERAEIDRLRVREKERDDSDKKRETEATFFQLLNLRNTILSNIAINRVSSSTKPIVTGQLALSHYFNTLDLYYDEHLSIQADKYVKTWPHIESELGHYLRFTYHIIRFVDENFNDTADKYKYVRLLRAQMSNDELCIIAVNCAHGHGAPKMKRFVEQYSLLHSLPEITIRGLRLPDQFASTAFGTAN